MAERQSSIGTNTISFLRGFMKKIIFEFENKIMVGYLFKEGIRQNAIFVNPTLEYRQDPLYIPKEKCKEYLKQAA